MHINISLAKPAKVVAYATTKMVPEIPRREKRKELKKIRRRQFSITTNDQIPTVRSAIIYETPRHQEKKRRKKKRKMEPSLRWKLTENVDPSNPDTMKGSRIFEIDNADSDPESIGSFASLDWDDLGAESPCEQKLLDKDMEYFQELLDNVKGEILTTNTSVTELQQVEFVDFKNFPPKNKSEDTEGQILEARDKTVSASCQKDVSQNESSELRPSQTFMQYLMIFMFFAFFESILAKFRSSFTRGTEARHIIAAEEITPLDEDYGAGSLDFGSIEEDQETVEDKVE